MSQSPASTADSARGQLERYRTGWQRLVERISAGESFSGHERNCAFLNLGPDRADGRFADVSFLSGMAFPDDARGIALTDWDRDGDLDLWISNRTSPAVRFLRNTAKNNSGFLQLQLVGTSCNRDAVGARVEVRDNDDRVLIQTVRAGESYLSQSSRILHFGLGATTGPVTVTVRWPGRTEPEQLGALAAGARYLVTEGRGAQPQPAKPAALGEETAAPADAAAEHARLVASTRPLFPPLRMKTPQGKSGPVLHPERPTLVNVWTSWCQACHDELQEWSTHAEAFADAGLEVVALNADALGGDARPGDAAAVINGIEFPGRWGTVERTELEFLHEILTSLTPGYRRPPVVPFSCLVDSHGQLAVLYRGPVDANQVLDDLSLLDLEPDGVRNQLTPFSGRWAHPPLPSSTMVAAGALRSVDQAMTERYLRHVVEVAPGRGPFPLPDAQRGEAAFALGSLLLAAGKVNESIRINEAATRFAPDDPRPWINLGGAAFQLEQWQAAVNHFTAALALAPRRTHVLINRGQAHLKLRDPDAATADFEAALALEPASDQLRSQLAQLYFQRGQDRPALAHYRRLSERHPESLDVTGPIAWILATSSEDALRDGASALELATRWCRATNYQDPNALNTLAAAQAETGRFDAAVQTIDSALVRAREAGLTTLLGPLEGRRRQYLEGKPFRR